jgi:hypothetical protein
MLRDVTFVGARGVQKSPAAGKCYTITISLGASGGVCRAGACASAYRSGRSPDWLKMKNLAAPAVKREAEEDWGKGRWR